jgi:hypothetical protein
VFGQDVPVSSKSSRIARTNHVKELEGKPRRNQRQQKTIPSRSVHHAPIVYKTIRDKFYSPD